VKSEFVAATSVERAAISTPILVSNEPSAAIALAVSVETLVSSEVTSPFVAEISAVNAESKEVTFD
jgi:hypothetical protein